MKINLTYILIVAGLISLLAGCASSSDPMSMAQSADPAELAKSAMIDSTMDSSKTMGNTAMAAAPGGSLTDTLVQELGVTPAQASGGAGAIFGAAKTSMSPGEFAQVSDAVPEMDSLLGAAPAMGGVGALGGSEALGAAGALSGVTGVSSSSGVSGMMAGAGALGGLAGPFGDLGMSPDMVGKFVPVIMDYVQTSGGASTAGLLKGALF